MEPLVVLVEEFALNCKYLPSHKDNVHMFHAGYSSDTELVNRGLINQTNQTWLYNLLY